jgi:hypothetical protein
VDASIGIETVKENALSESDWRRMVFSDLDRAKYDDANRIADTDTIRSGICQGKNRPYFWKANFGALLTSLIVEYFFHSFRDASGQNHHLLSRTWVG